MYRPMRTLCAALVLSAIALSAFAQPSLAQDPLPSWNDGDTKSSIMEFVKNVTDENSPGFVPEDERIATFDNDGTLWSEQPLYFQLFFALDRVKALAPQHPEWKTTEPFASVLKGDMKAVAASGEKGLMQLIAATHAGMSVTDFEQEVKDWITTAKHPTKDVLFTQMVYQPMLELLNYLRDNGFKTFIVSGGGIEFMRPWTEATYGIPPQQVVGSSLKMKFEMQDGIPTVMKLPEMDLVDDKDGKPVGIELHIGRRPIFAAGNSDGDLQMLQYTTIPRSAEDKTPRLAIIVHHTDAEREWAYDRDSQIGKLDVALDQASQRGWVIIDMKNDWKRIYPDSGK